jgi:FemAB-related protein (PEP-CTERM system-associated)
MSPSITTGLTITALDRREAAEAMPRLEAYALGDGPTPLSRHPAWASVLQDGLGHRATVLEASEGGRTRGLLALAEVRSLLFGRFLASLPYLNYGGPIADDDRVAAALVDRAVEMANAAGVRYLELRNVRGIDHPGLTERSTAKVNMIRPLPATPEGLWADLSSKVRNQVRKGQKAGLTVEWGGLERLDEFHAVFSRNMRDLGTPSYGRRFFAAILGHFPGRAEICVVRSGPIPVASALLLHGAGVTEVPSASSLREHNPTCANMLMYHGLLERAIARGQSAFDFGRSTPDGGTYQFKKQWGAEPESTVWQYHLRVGQIAAVRPDNPKYGRAIQIWRRLPLVVTRIIGPMIVRGIP